MEQTRVKETRVGARKSPREAFFGITQAEVLPEVLAAQLAVLLEAALRKGTGAALLLRSRNETGLLWQLPLVLRRRGVQVIGCRE